MADRTLLGDVLIETSQLNLRDRLARGKAAAAEA